MSRREVKESQFHLAPAKPEPKTRKKPVEFNGENSFTEAPKTPPIDFLYGVNGVAVEDPKKALAKKSVQADRTKWAVKFAKSGGQAGHMMNPWGMYFNPGDESIVEQHTGKPRYDFREVPENVFQLYMRFLETHNQLYLNNAERAFI